MSEVVIVGAGLSGTIMAYELMPYLRAEDRLTLIGQGAIYHFVPSNPWIAVGWRERRDIEIDLGEVMRRKKIHFVTTGARRIDPANKKIELDDGSALSFDYLVIATGPDLAFDEIPDRATTLCSVDLPCRPCDQSQGSVRAFYRSTGSDRYRRGSGRIMFRSGL